MEQQSNNAAKTISVVMLVTLLGKVMGLYRDRLLAVHYSVGVQANAFFTASRIPRVFFDAVFASLGEERRQGAVMVGDSLSSDIRGGIDAGLITVWFNPSDRVPDPATVPDKIIRDLGELPGYLGSLPSVDH